MKQLSIFRFRGAGALLAALILTSMQAACTYKKVNTDPTPTVTCTAPSSATVSYKTNVWPILKQNCRDACHNPQTAAQYANFDMDQFNQVQYWSTTKPSPSLPYSYLVGNIRHESGYVFMPVGGSKLSDCDIATIEAWVTAGTPNN